MKKEDAEFFIRSGSFHDAERVRQQLEHLPIGGVTTRDMHRLGSLQRDAIAEVDRKLKEARA